MDTALSRQFTRRYDKEYPVNKLDSCYSSYDGYAVLEDGFKVTWTGQACFAVWTNMSSSNMPVREDTSVMCRWRNQWMNPMYEPRTPVELGWRHRVEDIIFPRGLTQIYQQGYDDVVRKVFKLLPSFRELRTGQPLLTMSLQHYPMFEIQHNWRMVRAFQEHADFLSTCYWLLQHYPNMQPVVALTIASGMSVGPEGFGAGKAAHHPAIHNTFSFRHSLSIMRALHYQQGNGGVLWGADYTKANDRRLNGVENELFLNNSGRFPLGTFPGSLGVPVIAHIPYGRGMTRKVEHVPSEKLSPIDMCGDDETPLEITARFYNKAYHVVQDTPLHHKLPLRSVFAGHDYSKAVRKGLNPW